jgi:ribosomal protein S18 acetylase RimI-like enzyme
LHNDPTVMLDKEAKLDEYYIDTLSVNPEYAGKGIGENLAKIPNYNKISLLVDIANTRAFSLYKKLGYKQDKIVLLIGEPYVHLTKQIK